MQLLAFSSFIFFTGLVSCRPKTFNGSIDLGEISVNPNARPRIEPSYSRHSLASESRRSEGLDFCRKSAKCQTLNYTSCLGKELPYSQTTLELVGDSRTQEDVQEKLLLWQTLRTVPKCWAVIQPFLCALYMPRCENNMVELPSQEMCKVIHNPCRIVELEHRGGWPDFMRCDDLEKFPPGCKNEVRELKFNNITPKCQSPLVETNNNQAFVDGVDGCGLPCNSPLFSREEHEQVQRFTQTLAAMCLATNLFAVATFLIDWRSASRYPAVIIFYMNVCFAAACIGWLAQYAPNARHDILCRKDGTPRVSEPSGGETLSCVVIFILIYYFLMAASVWFVMLAYSWYISFQALGKIRKKVSSKAAYFHLVSWSVPLVLTITCMALAQVEAQSPHGICFVSNGMIARFGFVLAPVMILLLVGHVFLYKGLAILVRLKLSSAADAISHSANSKLRNTIVRLVCFSSATIGAVVLSVYCHFYDFDGQDQWKKSFRSYMVCLANQTTSRILHHGWAEDCELEHRPSMTLTQVHLIAVFGAGVSVSSWVWTKASVLAWRRWYRRTFSKKPCEERVRIRKHKIIAQAFAKRRDLNHRGRMSISIHSTHDDPVGFNIDLNSAASNDVSSAWAAAIPKFVTRRGAIVGAAGAFGLRRNSLDSETSVSAVRRISIAESAQSRRHSFDSHQSQYSIHSQAGMDLERFTRLHMRHGGRKRTMLRGRKLAMRRRGSITSQTSSKGSQILPAITKLALRRRGSVTSQASSKGSQILPAITKRKELLSKEEEDQQLMEQQRLQKDLERIERFSLNLPGDASSDDSDLDAEKGVAQSTQTKSVWEVATQTSPSLSLMRPVSSNATAPKAAAHSKATQMTPSSSATSSPEAVRKVHKPTAALKCHRERGQADGSPNGSTSELSDQVTALASPSQSLLDYLLPIKNQFEVTDDSSKSRSNWSKNVRSRDARAVEAIELDRSSIARLLDKLREDDNVDIENEDRPKRSYDRRPRLERNRRSQSERNDGNDVELDYLLGSKNSNRSDRSKKSENHRSRSKQDSTGDLEDSK